MTRGLRGQGGSSHVRSLRNLQVAVGVVVVGVVMPAVLMAMAVPVSMAVIALMEEEGEHTQEAELGVHVDSHCPLTSGPRNTSPPVRPPVLMLLCEGGFPSLLKQALCSPQTSQKGEEHAPRQGKEFTSALTEVTR